LLSTFEMVIANATMALDLILAKFHCGIRNSHLISLRFVFCHYLSLFFIIFPSACSASSNW